MRSSQTGPWLLFLCANCADGGKAGPPASDTGVHANDSDSDTAGGDSVEPPPVDADGDGYLSDVDCDDGDAEVNPGTTDACGDASDANCDGYASDCWEGTISLSDANATIAAESPLEYYLTTAPAGDVDGDGSRDILIGAQGTDPTESTGAAYVVRGGSTYPASVTDAWANLQGFAGRDFDLGWGVQTMGDQDGDGSSDVAVLGRVEGDGVMSWKAHVFMGLSAGTQPISDEDASIEGGSWSWGRWYLHSGAADLTGDDAPDLVIGGYDGTTEGNSEVTICEPPFSGSRSADDCEIVISDDVGGEVGRPAGSQISTGME